MSNATLQLTGRKESQSTARAKPTSTATPSHAHRSDKITDGHLARMAIVYVRQSTQHQVLEHRESTARQYALADRAVALGWPAAAVEVIDEDQGRSGSSAEGRSGFQRLLAAVSSDRVGIILGLEMSRLRGRARTGTRCWSCARSTARCWPTPTGSTIRASTTTGCCWASKGR